MLIASSVDLFGFDSRLVILRTAGNQLLTIQTSQIYDFYTMCKRLSLAI
ncbi:hypothetical protein SAMN05660226_00628 [Parapedobacter luteus]|uniref:Uncharacterized protein n=1 Tax=Parapedobacter luteus TaxID=623280 RepID=A0A1T5A674_9SPHI|nr:hypothetical protein SAMN05660226_00628 [Parapedobacter luteus]